MKCKTQKSNTEAYYTLPAELPSTGCSDADLGAFQLLQLTEQQNK
jgi:hypothetical protein